MNKNIEASAVAVWRTKAREEYPQAMKALEDFLLQWEILSVEWLFKGLSEKDPETQRIFKIYVEGAGVIVPKESSPEEVTGVLNRALAKVQEVCTEQAYDASYVS